MRRRAFIAAFGSSGCEVYLLVQLHAERIAVDRN